MCQMKIVLKDGDLEEVVLENASQRQATDDGIMGSALFEEPKFIRGANVTGIDFLRNRVTVSRTSTKASRESDHIA